MTTSQQRSEHTGHPVLVVTAKPKCFCGRDFTVEEFKMIVFSLRQLENLDSTLWSPNQIGGASPDDKSYESTIKELNRVMNKYDINSCLRKAHFLTQVYHETDRFRSTQEYTSSYTKKYDPFRGRGAIHLTHPEGYEKFAAEMKDNKIFTEPSIVATNTKYAFESGGWFWKKGSAWGNLNPKADLDDIYYINIGVNGGFMGFKERIDYVQKLIDILKVKNCVNINKAISLGAYSYSSSAIKNSKYGQKNERKFRSYDKKSKFISHP